LYAGAPEQKGSLATSPRGLLGQMRYGCKKYIWTNDWREEAALHIHRAHHIRPDDSHIGMSLSGPVGLSCRLAERACCKPSSDTKLIEGKWA
jgi:hypothetical protein